MINNNDYTWFFVIMTLLNTDIGLYNSSKNEKQDKTNEEILNKLNLILEKLNDK